MINIDMLTALEDTKNIFALLAGMKQQAIDAGFSEQVAELLILEMLKKQSA